MDIPLSVAVDVDGRSGDVRTDCIADMAMATAPDCHAPDALILLLHRHVWQPARYAHPAWLNVVGFHLGDNWHYGERPELDRCLNRALQVRRGTTMLPGSLTPRQRSLAQTAHGMPALALALGLSTLGCGDYFLLPAYRNVIRHWLDDALIWQLFGLCSGKRRAMLPPERLTTVATHIGSAILYRQASGDPVLFALLIRLPPPTRALWPPISTGTVNLLERVLCLYANYR